MKNNTSKTFTTIDEINEVVSTINSGVTEVVSGTNCISFSCDQLAGQYAFESALSDNSSLNLAAFEHYLDYLVENGADFNFENALGISIQHAKKYLKTL